ncbi:cell division protein FtsZ [Aliarcobacter faecis]|nr:cell division protein FtsZ [Aliarcobacter faecis]QKF73216.1 cell division protein FtsZ [Aliarcobacter faecis]
MENSNLFGTAEIKVTEQMPTRVLSNNQPKIAVIGVGGGGCNMVNHMIEEGAHKIDLIVANTDLQSLHSSKAPKKIELGPKLTKGFGAGMNPEVGRDSAIESYEEIKTVLEGTEIVFVASGLGGGTGTGAAAIIAKAAKDVGALTVSVVTKPFAWEGKKRAGLANLGLEELKKVSDSLIVIPNEKLNEIVDVGLTFKNSFKIVDNVLYQAVIGMSEVILNPGHSDINTDFADVKTIMKHKGIALMGIGKGKGENSVQDALDNAINSPLLDKVPLEGAKGILIHFSMSPNITLFAISSVMSTIHDKLDQNADIIFGTTTDKTLENDEIKVTIIATGFDSKNEDRDQLEGNGEENEQKSVPVDSENYLDTPPLMRDYKIQYILK